MQEGRSNSQLEEIQFSFTAASLDFLLLPRGLNEAFFLSNK